jgi:hypothetical protein
MSHNENSTDIRNRFDDVGMRSSQARRTRAYVHEDYRGTRGATPLLLLGIATVTFDIRSTGSGSLSSSRINLHYTREFSTRFCEG